jgi:serine/threonine protein kinase
MLSRLRHPNICLFMGASLRSPSYAIVTELVTRGSLWDVLREPETAVAGAEAGAGAWTGVGGSQSWSWERLHRVAHGIVCGMAYLHGHKVRG